MRDKKNYVYIQSYLVFLCLLLFFYACGETFIPLEDKSDSPFYMYGYLDASADTQWVRIIPVREQVDMPAEIPEMNVTIENLQTEEKSVMDDSLFQFRQEFNVVNSWSIMDIQPEQSYRIEGELPAGFISSVIITTPKDYPAPNIEDFQGGCSGNMRMSGIERLADVKSVWRIAFYFSGLRDERVITIPYRRRVLDLGKGNFSVLIESNRELSAITDQLSSTPDSINVLSREIFVASAGPEWNDEITDLEQLEYALPNINSNVENGVGYMIGIVSKSIELSHCF